MTTILLFIDATNIVQAPIGHAYDLSRLRTTPHFLMTETYPRCSRQVGLKPLALLRTQECNTKLPALFLEPTLHTPPQIYVSIGSSKMLLTWFARGCGPDGNLGGKHAALRCSHAARIRDLP